MKKIILLSGILGLIIFVGCAKKEIQGCKTKEGKILKNQFYSNGQLKKKYLCDESGVGLFEEGGYLYFTYNESGEKMGEDDSLE
ncbi:MAG: hypothetical protein ACRCSK_04775 [Fusobacteriaceae bacterium]